MGNVYHISFSDMFQFEFIEELQSLLNMLLQNGNPWTVNRKIYADYILYV